jgi:putative restriction endonuclease
VNYWTTEESLIALKMYCEIPFGKIGARNKSIVAMALKLKRTPNALAMKLLNFASFDPHIISSGRVGLKNASKADKELWQNASHDWDGFLTSALEAEARYDVLPISEQDEPSKAPMD